MKSNHYKDKSSGVTNRSRLGEDTCQASQLTVHCWAKVNFVNTHDSALIVRSSGERKFGALRFTSRRQFANSVCLVCVVCPSLVCYVLFHCSWGISLPSKLRMHTVFLYTPMGWYVQTFEHTSKWLTFPWKTCPWARLDFHRFTMVTWPRQDHLPVGHGKNNKRQ